MISTKEYISSIPRPAREIITSSPQKLELPHLMVGQQLIGEINNGVTSGSVYEVVKFAHNGVYLRVGNALLRTDADQLYRQGIIEDTLGRTRVTNVITARGGKNGI